MNQQSEQARSGKQAAIDDQIKEIIAAERHHIREQDAGEPLTGLALSGGGIRSASFGLGVMQAIYAGYNRESHGLLQRFDYLSTVSGGGYIGTALTWFVHQLGASASPVGAGEALGMKGVGARTEKSSYNQFLNFVRQHGNYLTPKPMLDLVSLVAVVLRSMFVSLAVYFAMAILALKLVCLAGAFMETVRQDILWIPLPAQLTLNYLLLLAIRLAISLGGLSLVFSVLCAYKTGAQAKYRFFIGVQEIFGLCSKLVLLLVLLGSLPYTMALFARLPYFWHQVTAVGLCTAVGALLGFFQSRRQFSEGKEEEAAAAQVAQAAAGAFFLVYGMLLAAYMVAPKLPIGVGLVWFSAAILFFGLMVNLNYAGLHRMYRDRLMEAFLPDADCVEANQWGPATQANVTLLSEVSDVSKNGLWPYQLINANVVLVDSADSRFRGRGGDAFLLSPLFCGSYATGYCPTADFANTGMSSRSGMTLATAMTISGAAANPNSGVAGKGVTRNKLVSTLMSLLNLRLGYWTLRPGKKKKIPIWPNYLVPGLFQGVFGCGSHENSTFVELTDGGHFENLGLYELIRRRVKLIVLSDGGADPGYIFDDLANAVERVRVDFGVQIRFRIVQDCDLAGILPGSGGPGHWKKKYKLAKRGFAIADIRYDRLDKTEDGILLYLKPTLINDLPTDIYGYKSGHPTFPDQPTTDQFFDESQFEAYRELGYQLTKQMLRDAEVQRLLGGFFQ